MYHLSEENTLISFPAGKMTQSWIERYLQEELATRNAKTLDAYARILHDFASWVSRQPGSRGHFAPHLITKTAVKTYFDEKKAERRAQERGEQASRERDHQRLDLRPLRYAPTTLSRMKVALGGFCEWLIAEGELSNNPTRGITLPKMAARPPRILTPDQRYAIKSVAQRATSPVIRKGKMIEGSADLRGAAIFALGYYAGFRVSDVSHLFMSNVHIGPKIGWVIAGYKQEKFREIDLLNEARKPLFDYIKEGKRVESPYVFTSQRTKKQIPDGDLDGWRLTEDGIHQWFQEVRVQALADEIDLVDDITFHDLRHDFGHRLREQGWNLEEIAYYLGHITATGTPAIQTTVRYTQIGRDQVREKLRQIRSI